MQMDRQVRKKIRWGVFANIIVYNPYLWDWHR